MALPRRAWPWLRGASTLGLLGIAASLLLAAGADDSGPLRIDCGSAVESGVAAAAGFTADQYTSDGTPFTIAAGSLNSANLTANLSSAETTGRAFSNSSGGCYKIPRANGTYLVRLGFAYLDFDQQANPPVFNVTAQGVPVLTVNLLVAELLQNNDTARMATAHYRDFIAFTSTGFLDICLVPFSSAFLPTSGFVNELDLVLAYPSAAQSRTPLLNTLEVFPTPSTVYGGAPESAGVILANAMRVNIGGPTVGPDLAGRVWDGDDRSYLPRSFRATNATVKDTGAPDDYWPQAVLQTYRESIDLEKAQAGTEMQYSGMVVPMDPSNLFVVVLNFVEPNPAVKRGQRVMDVQLFWGDGQRMAMGLQPEVVDIVNETTPLTALALMHVVQLQTPMSYFQKVFVQLHASNKSLPAVISAMEVYEAIRLAPSTPDGGTAAPTAGSSMTLTAEQAHVLAPPPPPPSTSSGLSAGSIAAIVLGVLLGVVLVGGGVFFVIKRKQNPTPFTKFDGGGGASATANLVV
ncbi:hypothetical protein CLOM_g16516 [Closterium sp. NIES-68]|nr:hypothetical protein CLOM_g16516 [Closterium sp. NIES-68]GJP70882.1 hypothetical protein CLOP_g1774 [Closterium sp. NIES-67]